MHTTSDPTPNSQTNGRLDQLLLIGLLLCAFGLRVYAIDASSLWSDEGNTWALMDRSFLQIARAAAADIHPPGYYWLLKVWGISAGYSAGVMRLFSAFLGTLLVLLIYRIGCIVNQTFFYSTISSTASSPAAFSTFAYPLLAALIATLNPLQIFYSQEARMYMLLAVAGSLLILAFCQIMRVERANQALHFTNNRRKIVSAYVLYIISGILGLWTHYSFPICLAVVGISYLAHLFFSGQQKLSGFLRFALANILIVLGYLPWLPTSVERILNWPKGGEAVPFMAGLEMILRTFMTGPLRDRMGLALDVHWAWLLVGGILPVVGLLAIYWSERSANARASKDRANSQAPPIMTTLLALWLGGPLIMMLVFGLLTDAFLKFLLVAAPAWTLMLAAAPFVGQMGTKWLGRWIVTASTLGLAIGAGVFGWQVLPSYYTNPLTRDNYAGIARYIDAIPATASAKNLLLLNAPGQQEVWRYYSSQNSKSQNSKSQYAILALPAMRPIDEQQTIAQLAEAIPQFQQIFALFWAADEADPNRVVEKWLDQHLFKSIDSWQGNVRFVRYDSSDTLQCNAFEPTAMFGTEIKLTNICLTNSPVAEEIEIRAGEALLIGLHWQTRTRLKDRYKTTLQLLDSRNQVIAQRDSAPAGGSMPTDSWIPNTQIVDNYGLVVPAGTPPKSYRLIVALYDEATNQRLLTPTGDHLALRAVKIARPERTMPVEIVPMGYRTNQTLGSVTLVGYDMHRKGYAHQPLTPIPAGDLVHVTLYWQAPDPLPADWESDLQFSMRLGAQQLKASLASAEYPTAEWTGGEFVRGEFDILYTGLASQIEIQVNNHSLQLHQLPD